CARAGDHVHSPGPVHVVQPRVPRSDPDHGPHEVEVAACRQREWRAVPLPTLPARAIPGRPRGGARYAPGGADPRAGTRAATAPARVLRWSAAAAHDCDGAAPTA